MREGGEQKGKVPFPNKPKYYLDQSRVKVFGTVLEGRKKFLRKITFDLLLSRALHSKINNVICRK